jgi:hypothetical protein
MSRSTKVELEFSLFLTELQQELARDVPPEEPAWIRRPLKEFKNLLPPLFEKYRWMFAQDAAETWKSRGVKRAIRSNETRMASVIERAASDRAASQGLHDYIRDQMKSQEPLAPAAKAYLDALLAGEIPPPKSPAGRPATTEIRDQLVIPVLKALVEEYGLRPTRARKRTATATACSVVAEALALARIHVSEDTIEQIWKQHRRASRANEGR